MYRASPRGWIFTGLALVLAALVRTGDAKPGSGPVELELAESVTVMGTHYRLKDVIRTTGSKGWRTRDLDTGFLGRSPRPGYVAHLTRTRIAARLEALSPGIHQRIRWKGASTVKVRAAGVSVSRERLVEFARNHLVQELAARFDAYKAEAVANETDLIVPVGEVQLAASLNEGKRIGTRTCVWVDVSIDGEHFQTVPVWFDVEGYQTVWVAGEDQNKHAYLDAGKVRRVRHDIAALAAEPVAADASLEALRLRKAIVAGQVITREMIEPIPAVEKGKKVTVHARSGRIQLRTRAIALSDGELAQRIRIQNTNRGEPYTAVVVGQGEVAVDGN